MTLLHGLCLAGMVSLLSQESQGELVRHLIPKLSRDMTRVDPAFRKSAYARLAIHSQLLI